MSIPGGTPPKPPVWKPTPEALQRQGHERSDKSEATALEILRIAVEVNKGKTIPITAGELADYAETLWQWTTTDSWPPK